MAPTIAAVLSFIPTNIWRPLKKFLTKDGIIVFDIPFKLSTKYTPALLMVMMCLSFANQFVRNVEMDCSSSSQSSSGGSSGRSGGYSSGGDSELNDFCWNHETFLVAKALDPKMRGEVTYPGVSRYTKGTDELIRQRYYKYVWLILGKLAVLSFLPLFLWKFRGTEKIKSLVEIIPIDNASEDDTRVTYYLETVGFNDSFAYHYLACKLFAAISPYLQWYYLCGFIGRLYKYYGVNVLLNFMDDSDPWPNPMDALFPKIAKCEWTKYGYSGDMELKAAQCQLPMNNLTQWSFFLYWWWLALVFVINFVSCFRVLFILFPPYRRFQYRRFVGKACREDIEVARTYSIQSNGKMITKKRSKCSIIDVNLSFGDWLVLDFVKKNLQDWQFRELVRRMVLTKNNVLQLKPVKTHVHANGSGGGKWYQNGHANGGVKTGNMEIGFKESVLNGQVPPTYITCETSDCDMNELLSSPLNSMLESPPPMGGLPQLHTSGCNGVGIDSGLDLPSQEYSINISPPVKIDRSNFKKKPIEKDVKKGLAPGINKGKKPEPVRGYGFRVPAQKPSAPAKKDTSYDDDDWNL